MPDLHSKHAQEIIRAAVMLFKEHGYEKVSVNDICKAAQISRSTFYLLFTGKKDIILYVFAEAKKNQNAAFEDFMDADNDFDRMWSLCNRFLTITLSFGPELSCSLLSMELTDPIGVLDLAHTLDPWLLKLTRNGQKSGVILNPEPPELLVPLVTDLMYQVVYEWSKCKGSFSLREKARNYAEAAYCVAPEYRWSAEKKAEL